MPRRSRERLAGAELVDERVHATGNYSYAARSSSGERYLMLGDAYAFIDPVFSSGVYLAMQSAFDGADVVEAVLDGRREAAARARRFDRNDAARPARVLVVHLPRHQPDDARVLHGAAEPVPRQGGADLAARRRHLRQDADLALDLRMLKALYYLVSLGNLGRTLRAWKRRRVNIRDVEAQAS